MALFFLPLQPFMSTATITTNKGVLEFELFDKETPITAENFKKLATEKFYDGLTFHRVIPGFVVQGGCPHGAGHGGPGYNIPCETKAEKQFHEKGVLSMAHAGKDTGGSQFFIVLDRNATAHLDGAHTVFGKIIKGIELIDDLVQGDVMESVTITE